MSSGFREKSKMFCPKCGVEVVTKDSNFCLKCGFDLRKISSTKSIAKNPSPLVASGVQQPHRADGVRKTIFQKKTSTLRVILLMVDATLVVLILGFTVALVLSPSLYVKAKVAVRRGNWAQIPKILFGPSEINEARQLARERNYQLAIEKLAQIPQSDPSWVETQQFIRLLRIEWGKYLWDSGEQLNAAKTISLVSLDSILSSGVLQPIKDYEPFLAKIVISRAVDLAKSGYLRAAFSSFGELRDRGLEKEVASGKKQICEMLLEGNWQCEKDESIVYRFSSGTIYMYAAERSVFIRVGHYDIPSLSLAGKPLSFSVPPAIGRGVATFICNGAFEVGRKYRKELHLAIIVHSINSIEIMGEIKNGMHHRVEFSVQPPVVEPKPN
jgi:ribosomal protein L37E